MNNSLEVVLIGVAFGAGLVAVWLCHRIATSMDVAAKVVAQQNNRATIRQVIEFQEQADKEGNGAAFARELAAIRRQYGHGGVKLGHLVWIDMKLRGRISSEDSAPAFDGPQRPGGQATASLTAPAGLAVDEPSSVPPLFQGLGLSDAQVIEVQDYLAIRMDAAKSQRRIAFTMLITWVAALFAEQQLSGFGDPSIAVAAVSFFLYGVRILSLVAITLGLGCLWRKESEVRKIQRHIASLGLAPAALARVEALGRTAMQIGWFGSTIYVMNRRK